MTADDAHLTLVEDAPKARVLLSGPRPELLKLFEEPLSAAGAARRLGLGRQQVNYHVRALARAGFLRRAGRRQCRGLKEQLWRVSSRAFLLAPGLVQGQSPPADAPPASPPAQDPTGVAALLLLGSRMQAELGRSFQAAKARNGRVPVLAMDAELRFHGAAERAAFAQALTDAVTRAIKAHTVPAQPASGTRRSSRGAWRLLLGCYPIPPDPRG